MQSSANVSLANGPKLEPLCCPFSHQSLISVGSDLSTVDKKHSYPVDAVGIPHFAENFCSPEARIQQVHFERVHEAYLKNLNLPQVEEYNRYLNDAFLKVARAEPLGDLIEICCGQAEAFALLKNEIQSGVGVDISPSMLKAARQSHPEKHLQFIQADATLLPLRDNSFDTVCMLGGIHHVQDRKKLFSEVHRILRPGGRFLWREPVSDFPVWKALRWIIYHLSPNLNAQTERPLLYQETVPVLEAVGMKLTSWETYGFLGFCLLMNTDILIFNKAFRFIPGIRALTHSLIQFDEAVRHLPYFARFGTQVIGVAKKP